MNFLILSVTAGEGHNSTARAVKTELERLGAYCTVLDTFDYISPELAKLISEGYLLVTEKAKTAYKLGYRMAEKRRPDSEHAHFGILYQQDAHDHDHAHENPLKGLDLSRFRILEDLEAYESGAHHDADEEELWAEFEDMAEEDLDADSLQEFINKLEAKKKKK